MKKLFLLLFVLGAGLSVQAQKDWSELNQIFSDELYPLAKDVAEITNNVTAQSNVISIIKENGTTSLVKEQDKSVPIDYFNYKLLTSTGRQITLDKMQAHKVVDKFLDVLKRVKETAKENNDAEVRKILESL
ncbi:hypothetical protein IWQ47_004795 [Aquimarina sp. EL_43]|uniref:hypothetical protein n=1 Tax=unclassified Aquimarina TaxID=2627091 RepID=UPI0018CACF93|nr:MULTISPECIES: hypothetical protein [unclassified Aquimarina]MBG6133385.1 hypothetical protein [Aquimarina sp. EL_35]MBG6153543.1 hypothetical protein [Aquimarina sp. EL_32]MBG6171699.1 hypothetical protein [Aquimarina sp. EL_43]